VSGSIGFSITEKQAKHYSDLLTQGYYPDDRQKGIQIFMIG
jgi:hypothetical protein